MKTLKVVSVIEGEPMFDQPLPDFLAQCEVGGIIQLLTEDEYITLQQIRWIKGVLLPALSKDSGDSVEWWETFLKMSVMPDEFSPEFLEVNGGNFFKVPSITKLGKKKMNIFIEGSVAKCHEIGKLWVTLPDKELRK